MVSVFVVWIWPVLTLALCLIQLCRLSEDLAAFPHADGRHPHSGSRCQPAVTWEASSGH